MGATDQRFSELRLLEGRGGFPGVQIGLAALLPTNSEVGVMVEEVAENAVAVLSVFSGIEEVVVPHQVDESAGDERPAWVALVEREEAAVVTLRNVGVDRLAVKYLTFAVHLEQDGAKVDLGEVRRHRVGHHSSPPYSGNLPGLGACAAVLPVSCYQPTMTVRVPQRRGRQPAGY